MIYQNFNDDLLVGKEAEQRVAWYCMRWDKDTYVQQGKDSGKDVVMPNLNKLLEVKSCPVAKEYQNVPVEVCDITYKKKSGLSVTKADAWVFMVTDIYVFIPTPKLIAITKDLPIKKRETEPGHIMGLKILPNKTLYTYSSRIVGHIRHPNEYTDLSLQFGMLEEDLRWIDDHTYEL